MEVKTRDFRQIILDFPKQFNVGLEAAENVKIPGKFTGVIVCGMGGSALPGDILKIWLDQLEIDLPVKIHRDYFLPSWVKREKDLIVCVSYSGNTEEPISAFKEARKKKMAVVVIASGGKLAELSKKNKIPLALVPSGLPPRMALGYQFSALAKILANFNLIPEDNLKEILSLEKSLKPLSSETAGERIAENLFDKFFVIYSSGKNEALARIWKIKFNENSKIPAFSGVFPELNHNEMASWTHPQRKFYIIMLEDQSDHPGILKRIKLTADIIRAKGTPVQIVKITGKDNLFKIFSNIILSDWVSYWASYYLLLKQRVDHIPIPMVEEFKRKMGKIK